jgi:hypothetical protein
MAPKELRVRSSTLAAAQSTDEVGLTEVMRRLITRAAR